MTTEPVAIPYLKAKIVLEGAITCLTGLHIGGAETGVDVGGIDKFVVRNPRNDEPYIPGSSIKGKLRSLIEYASDRDAVLESSTKGVAVMPSIPSVLNLFGTAINNGTGQASKVLFRDAVMRRNEAKTVSRFSNGLKYTERKAENTLKRVTGKATPRQIERVPAETIFDFSLVLNVDEQNVEAIAEQLSLLKVGFELLRLDGLGGMVSRGYGRIKINWEKSEIYLVETAPNFGLKLDNEYQHSSEETSAVFENLIARAKQLWSSEQDNGS